MKKTNNGLVDVCAAMKELGNGLEKKNLNEKKVPLKVTGIIYNLDKEEYRVDFKIYDMISKKYKKSTLPLCDISVKTIKNMVAKNGGDCRNIEHIATILCNGLYHVIEKETNLKYQYESLGWGMMNGDVIFKGTKIYSNNLSCDSEYVGKFQIKETGNFEEYLDMLKTHVVGNTPMEAIVAMGVGATLLSYYHDYIGNRLYTPINHLVGNSTTGKSTAADLFVSLGGCPKGEDTYMLSFLSTPNAIIKKLEGNHGYPCSIDEFSTGLGKKGWSDFVYTLANGLGKERCGAGGAVLQKAETFSTVILTNGEMSILQKCNQNEGIRARLFEFCDVGWTRSAEEAENIKNVCSNNYGFVTPLVASEIMKNSTKWQKRLEKWKGFAKRKISKDKIFLSIGNRISDYVAIYVTAIEIAKEVLGLNFNVKEVFKFFYKWIVVKNAEEANLGTRVYDAIKLYVAMNKSKFHNVSIYYDDLGQLEEGKIGFKIEKSKPKIINGEEYNIQCIILPDKMEEILLPKGFTDVVVAMKTLKDMKLLQTKDSSRVYYEKTINNVKNTKVYAIWIKEDPMEFYEQTMREVFGDK